MVKFLIENSRGCVVRFTAVLFLGLIVTTLGCSNGENGSTPVANKPAAPAVPQKLTSPNLQCIGETPSGISLTIDAEISDIHRSEQQPNLVLFGTSTVLVTIDGKAEDLRSNLFTMIGYILHVGGYISSISIDSFHQSTGIEWSLLSGSGDITKSDFTLVKKERLDNGKIQSEEIGNVICKFSWKI